MERNFQHAEPFRIKVVEPIKKTTRAYRTEALKEAQYNAFRLKAEDVYVDCLTDSGTTAMSTEQWSAMMLGDESYAGCKSFYKLEASAQEVFGMPYVQPTHQGRGADFIMAQYYAKPGKYAVGNMHFDTFHGNAEILGAIPVDCVIDSGLDAAMGYAQESGIPYGVGLVKNRYIGRTFITPGQQSREQAVRIKLGPLKSCVEGKRVVMIDDSIVRGTTSRQIVTLLREAGAREVHMRSSAPPFIAPCYFGTDIPDKDSLIACRYSVEEIRALIGADSLGFLSLEALHQIAPDAACGFCDGCFTGAYPIAT